CWAPLIPYAKARVGADDRMLGLILLCLGIGAILAMPFTGWLSARVGSKPMVVASGIALALLLPGLSVASQPPILVVVLLGFGASLGTLDVAMNIHAVEVERNAKVPLMSGFHAMYSVGGFIGAGAMTFLLSSGLTPWSSALIGGAITAIAIVIAWPRLLSARGGAASFALPHGIVLLISGLGAVMFLAEGAMLDWGALLMIGKKLVPPEQGGVGYMLFSIAMTIGRLTGDRLVARAGNCAILTWGGLVAVVGFTVLLTAPFALAAMVGCLLVGLGASNIVPVLFRIAGNQKAMPANLAVAALTTVGYGGILAGPAAIGYISQRLGLPGAFWLLVGLVSFVPLCARRLTRE
ncbi:MAG TPA: MFS transporter, partial [Opitutaceae bacterium]